MIIIELPCLPITVNQAFATFRGRRITTREYKAFNELVEKLIPDGMPDWGNFTTLSVVIEFYSETWFTKKGVRKRDVDNFIKPLLDSIFKHFDIDDSQIFDLKASKKFGPDRTVVKIFHLDEH